MSLGSCSTDTNRSAELSRCYRQRTRRDQRDRSGKGIGAGGGVQFGKTFRTRNHYPSKKSIAPELIYELLGDEMRMLHGWNHCVLSSSTRDTSLMRVEEVSVGSMNESIAHPREIFRPALITRPTQSSSCTIIRRAIPHRARLITASRAAWPKRQSFCKSNCSITSSSVRHRKPAPVISVSKRQACCSYRKSKVESKI